LSSGNWDEILSRPADPQHLRIKAFYGTSPRAVRTQIWTACRLSARHHFEETSALKFQPLHYATDFEPDALRENSHFTRSGSISTSIPIHRPAKTPMFTGVLNRTVVIENIAEFPSGAESNEFPKSK
jgi:hypothetical protein